MTKKWKSNHTIIWYIQEYALSVPISVCGLLHADVFVIIFSLFRRIRDLFHCRITYGPCVSYS